MSFDYASKRIVADTMIEKYGRTITIRRASAGTYDPATGTMSGSTDTDYTAKAVVMSASKGTVEAFDIRIQGGTLLESNLRSLIVSAENLSITPQPGDQVIMDSETWSVLGNTPLAPDGTVVMHQVGIKKG